MSEPEEISFTTAADYRGERAWDAMDLAEIDGTTVRLHWTDTPYIWHRNDGDEVFTVLDGEVDMHYRDGDGEHIRRMRPGDIAVMREGAEHVAHPVGPARILVIERKGSI